MNSRTPETRKRSLGKQVFLYFLGFVVVFYVTILTYHVLVPKRAESEKVRVEFSLLEQCRELCLANGLIPTGHVANDAKAFLRSEKPRPLVEPLYEILEDTKFESKDTQQHPLLGKTAPDFELSDDKGAKTALRESLKDGTVVLVFYYGYHCNHCVGQLFGLNEDLKRFTELGTTVVAISADPHELTAKRFDEYGRFDFPVLADIDERVAEAYGVFRREEPGKPEIKLHGTFIIDSDGTVIWCNTGSKPFLDNRTLLMVIARQHGLLPSKPAK